MEYSKGEWKVGNRVDSRGKMVYFPVFSGKKYIAASSVFVNRVNGSTLETKLTTKEATANAYLIASAPDMYEALRAIDQMLNSKLMADVKKQIFITFPVALGKLDIALAKAEGWKRDVK
jgi:hypothetical protein